MQQTFREWVENELQEEEKWFTTKSGHRMAYDTETNKITKGMFTGSLIDKIKDKFKRMKDDRDTEKAVKELRKVKAKYGTGTRAFGI